MSTTATKVKTTTRQQPKAGRDARGRFTKGNKGGPGNPFAREVAVLRATMIHAFTPKIFMRLVEVLRQRAEGGDMVAMKLILQYVLGKPAETVDPDRIAIDEWQKLRDAAVSLDETSAVLEQVPATMACFLLTEEILARRDGTARSRGAPRGCPGQSRGGRGRTVLGGTGEGGRGSPAPAGGVGRPAPNVRVGRPAPNVRRRTPNGGARPAPNLGAAASAGTVNRPGNQSEGFSSEPGA